MIEGTADRWRKCKQRPTTHICSPVDPFVVNTDGVVYRQRDISKQRLVVQENLVALARVIRLPAAVKHHISCDNSKHMDRKK